MLYYLGCKTGLVNDDMAGSCYFDYIQSQRSPSSDPPKYNPEDVRQPIELPMTLQMTQLRLVLFPLPIITLERGSSSVCQVVKCLCAAIHMSSRGKLSRRMLQVLH